MLRKRAADAGTHHLLCSLRLGRIRHLELAEVDLNHFFQDEPSPPSLCGKISSRMSTQTLGNIGECSLGTHR